MGLYQTMFNRSWLVQAFGVNVFTEVKKFFDAPTREAAEEKMRYYLTQENIAFERVEASFG